MDCDDDCNGRLDCKNKRVQKCTWKKLEVRITKDGQGIGLFAMKDTEKNNICHRVSGQSWMQKNREQLLNEDYWNEFLDQQE